METAIATYIMIFLAILATLVLTVVLFGLGRRLRKEQSFVGFSPKTRDEHYAGFALFSIGFSVIIISIYQIAVILIFGLSSNSVPFGLSSLPLSASNQSTLMVSIQILGVIESISFWLMIVIYGGGKLASLGLDLLRGRKIKLRLNHRKIAVFN